MINCYTFIYVMNIVVDGRSIKFFIFECDIDNWYVWWFLGKDKLAIFFSRSFVIVLVYF